MKKRKKKNGVWKNKGKWIKEKRNEVWTKERRKKRQIIYEKIKKENEHENK